MLKFHDHFLRALSFAALGSVLAIGACGDDGAADDSDGSSSGDSDSASTTTAGMTSATTMGATSGGPMTCLGAGEGAAADGDPCTANGDCMSGVCLLFNDTPPTPDATCAPTPAACETRVTATLKNLSDGMPIAGTTVNIVKALDAITNPTGATPLASAMSGGDGRLDVTTDEMVNAPFGIVAVASGGDFFATATGVAAPNDANEYTVGTGIHEFWAVPSADLTAWSDALGMDAMVPADGLPLGENGGVIGLIRDGETGMPAAGATAAPADEGSGMTIRYLQDDGSFDDVGTGTAGIFVALGVQATGEDFSITTSDGKTGGGTAGSAANVVFTLIVDAT